MEAWTGKEYLDEEALNKRFVEHLKCRVVPTSPIYYNNHIYNRPPLEAALAHCEFLGSDLFAAVSISSA